MQRDDIAWLLVKASGLWLVIEGVYYLPAAVMTLHRWTEKDNGESLIAFLDSGIPLAIGLFLLFANVEPMLRAMGVERRGRATRADGEDAPTKAVQAAPRGLDRYDWLWVAFKVCGLLIAAYGVMTLAGIIPMGDAAIEGGILSYYLATGGIFVVVGLALLFGDAIWSLAARARHRSSGR